jgi:hypothetical protein
MHRQTMEPMPGSISIHKASTDLGIPYLRLYHWVQTHADKMESLGAYKPEPVWNLTPEAIDYIKENYRTVKKTLQKSETKTIL